MRPATTRGLASEPVDIGTGWASSIANLVLTVGVWRARTVPRSFLLLGAIASSGAFVVPPSRAAGLVVEGLSSLTTIAIGWYAWRLYAGRGARG